MLTDMLLVNRKFSDINPLLVGTEKCVSGHTYGPAVREYYLIHYVTSGKGTFQADGKEYRLTSGDMFLIRPQQVTTYLADQKEPWTYIWVGFTSSLALQDIFEKNVISAQDCGSIFFSLLECEKFGEYAELFVCGKIYELIACLKKDKTSETNQMKRYALMAKNYIETNYDQDISVSEIARQLGLDRSYFSTIFKNVIGKPPQQYIVDYRLEKAAHFMSTYHYTPLQAARYCGYSDLFNFSKMFKKKYGVAPRYYRNVSQLSSKHNERKEKQNGID